MLKKLLNQISRGKEGAKVDFLIDFINITKQGKTIGFFVRVSNVQFVEGVQLNGCIP